MQKNGPNLRSDINGLHLYNNTHASMLNNLLNNFFN